jgi:hypothetical protein
MCESVHIIGCGSVGYSISQLIPTLPNVKSIHLYDPGCFDSLDAKFKFLPKVDCEYRMNKAISAQLQLWEKYRNIEIRAYEKKVIKTEDMSGLIIDCRDIRQQVKLDCNFSVYADKDKGIIDGSKSKATRGFDRNYLYGNKTHFFSYLAKEVIKYIDKEAYSDKLKIEFLLEKNKIIYIKGYGK